MTFIGFDCLPIYYLLIIAIPDSTLPAYIIKYMLAKIKINIENYLCLIF